VPVAAHLSTTVANTVLELERRAGVLAFRVGHSQANWLPKGSRSFVQLNSYYPSGTARASATARLDKRQYVLRTRAVAARCTLTVQNMDQVVQVSLNCGDVTGGLVIELAAVLVDVPVL